MNINGKGAKLAVTAGLAAALTLGGVAPAVQAFATQVGSITIESTANYTVKGNYKVYQLFTGSFTNDADGNARMGDVTENAAYGDTVLSTLNTVLSADRQIDVTGLSADRRAIAITDGIASLDATQAQAFANKLAGALVDAAPTQTVAAADGKLNVTDLATGYYMVINPDATYARTSAVLVPVDGDKTVDIKASTPTVTKQAKVGNGEYGDNNDVGLVDSSAWEAITYKIEGTVASNIDDYTTYSYKFQDTLPAGINADTQRVAGWNVKVEAALGGTTKDVTAAFTTAATGTNQVTWGCTDLIAALKDAGFTGSLSGVKITLTYTPDYTVDELRGALAGDVEGATNSVKLIYSNNPYGTGAGESSSETEDTPKQESKVYTYEIAISKVNEAANVLTGAGFTLQRDGKDIFTDQKVDDHGILTFTGLDSNVEYTLIESTTPSGMKSIDPIKFTINATKDAKGTVTKVEAAETADPSGAADFTDDNTADSVIKVQVTNIEGADLPLTGQQGIIAGVAVGGIVIAASLVAVVRNRKQAE